MAQQGGNAREQAAATARGAASPDEEAVVVTASPSRGKAGKAEGSKSSAAESVSDSGLDLSPEDTGPIVPKGTVTNAPKVSAAAITQEERDAVQAARNEADKMAKKQAKPARTAFGQHWRKLQASPDRLSFFMAFVALGVVYGDIGTSPLYVMQTFVAGQGGLGGVTRTSIFGMLSLLFWTMTLITTIKYVIIMLRVGNRGEGGLFALYSMVRRYGKWIAIPAMIGGAAFLADSVLTPAVSISSAVGGLASIPAFSGLFAGGVMIPLIITAVIIVALFIFQSRGTEGIGKVFGPLMLVWFAFIALMGILSLGGDWSVFSALNPVYGAQFLFSGANKEGLAIMGTVFLAITGAEALYSDMGHVGRGSIYMTWPVIKIALVVNYFGQGAWLLRNLGNPALASHGGLNPFFEMMDPSTRSIGVILSVIAGIIASQALITGAYTMVSEATSLNWMPHLQVRYPARTRGQLYIPAVNLVLCVLTLTVLGIFQTSERMTAAYGLSLTITMIATTVLLCVYLWHAKKQRVYSIVIGVVYLTIQIMFLLASMAKFFTGGWFTITLAALILFVMYSWEMGTRVERSQRRHLSPEEFLPALNAMHGDIRMGIYADNVVYLTPDQDMRRLDTDIFYSIFANKPKRAKAWWAVSVQVTDDPFTREYAVENFGTDFIFRVRLRLGFKVSQNVATYLHQVMHELIDSGELPPQATIYPKIDEDQQVGTIRFVLIHKNLIPESKINARGAVALRVKYGIRHVAGNPVKWFGLAAYDPKIEVLPLFVTTEPIPPLKRTALRKGRKPIVLHEVLAAAAEKQQAEERVIEKRAEAAKARRDHRKAIKAAVTASAVETESEDEELSAAETDAAAEATGSASQAAVTPAKAAAARKSTAHPAVAKATKTTKAVKADKTSAARAATATKTVRTSAAKAAKAAESAAKSAAESVKPAKSARTAKAAAAKAVKSASVVVESAAAAKPAKSTKAAKEDK